MGNTASDLDNNGFTKSSSYSALNLQNKSGHIYANAINSNSSGNINGHLNGIKRLNLATTTTPTPTIANNRKKSVSTTSLSSFNAKCNNNIKNNYEKHFKNFICGNNLISFFKKKSNTQFDSNKRMNNFMLRNSIFD